MNERECSCPDTFPDWHLQDIDLSGKSCHTLKIASFLFMPLSYDTYIYRQQLDIEQMGLDEEWPRFVMTTTGMFGGTIRRLIKNAESPSRFIQHFGGNFTLQGFLHLGDISTVKDGIRQLQNRLFDKGRVPKELYMCYLTCPRCSEAKGGEKILLLRRWVESPTLVKRLNKNR